MDKEEKGKGSKEGKNMALLARSNDTMFIIDKNKSKKFIEDSKKNTITPEFLKRCLEYSSMFKKNKDKK